MNFPQRLLELSETLTNLEKTRPRQATLRRAVSTAYYAVYHLLAGEYASLFSDDRDVQSSIARTINHKDVAGVARDFSPTIVNLPEALKSRSIVATPELIEVARSFNILQSKRLDADYNLSFDYTREEVESIVERAKDVFAKWASARKTPAAKIFLSCFQLKKPWDEKR